MIVSALTGTASLILFFLATMLMYRASAKPPLVIRTASHRSPAEYEYGRHRAALRRQGFLCLMAGMMNLGVCLIVGLMAAINTTD